MVSDAAPASLWRYPAFHSLSDAAKLLCLYLIYGDEYGKRSAMAALGLDADAYEAAKSEIERVGIVPFHTATGRRALHD